VPVCWQLKYVGLLHVHRVEKVVLRLEIRSRLLALSALVAGLGLNN